MPRVLMRDELNAIRVRASRGEPLSLAETVYLLTERVQELERRLTVCERQHRQARTADVSDV